MKNILIALIFLPILSFSQTSFCVHESNIYEQENIDYSERDNTIQLRLNKSDSRYYVSLPKGKNSYLLYVDNDNKDFTIFKTDRILSLTLFQDTANDVLFKPIYQSKLNTSLTGGKLTFSANKNVLVRHNGKQIAKARL